MASVVRSYRCSLNLICIVVSIQLQKCTGLLKPELPAVNQMEPGLCGRWQVFQRRPMECTWVESHVRPINSKMRRPPKAEAEIAEEVPLSRLSQTHQLLPDLSLPRSASPPSLLCFSFSPQVLFCSRDSSAGLQGCSWLDNLGVAGSFFGVQESCRESWSPPRISTLWEATGNMPLCSTPEAI